MGYIFRLKDTNIIAFLTGNNKGYPSLTGEQLLSFLDTLKSDRLISRHPEWISHLEFQAKSSKESLEDFLLQKKLLYFLENDALSVLDSDMHNKDDVKDIQKFIHRNEKYLDNGILKLILTPIKTIFSSIELFGMPIYWHNQDGINYRIREYAQQIADDILENALILIPDDLDSDNVELLSAAMQLQALARVNGDGMLFWDKQGHWIFIKYNEMQNIANYERHGLEKRILHDMKRQTNYIKKEDTLPLILHLSDLHFGDENAANNFEFCIRHFERVGDIRHIVITGDLMNSPSTSNCLLLRYFIERLKEVFGAPVTYIPGNHDLKWYGFLNQITPGNCQEVKFDSRIIIDDNLRVVFFCINSTDSGVLARGHVTSEQLIEIGREFIDKLTSNPQIDGYTKVALLHHHPFEFTSDADDYIVKAKFYVHKITKEKTLKLGNALEFIEWCDITGISMILHGHKHMQRYIEYSTDYRKIVSVGCGTTTGAKGEKLSYNIIAINNRDNMYGLSFFSGKNNGSGFLPQFIKIQREFR